MLICWPAGWTIWASQRNAGSEQINKHCKPILNFSFIRLKTAKNAVCPIKIMRNMIPLKAEILLWWSDCYSFQENVPGNSLAGITKTTRFVFVQIRLPFVTNSIFANHARSQATHRVERTQNWLRQKTGTHTIRNSRYSWETNNDNETLRNVRLLNPCAPQKTDKQAHINLTVFSQINIQSKHAGDSPAPPVLPTFPKLCVKLVFDE